MKAHACCGVADVGANTCTCNEFRSAIYTDRASDMDASYTFLFLQYGPYWNCVQCDPVNLTCGCVSAEIPRHDVAHTVRFFGSVEEGEDGKKKWVGGETVEAVAYDVPIPGYKTKNVISLRLWQATAPAPAFDLYSFNAGEHDKAAHAQNKAEEVGRLNRVQRNSRRELFSHQHKSCCCCLVQHTAAV